MGTGQSPGTQEASGPFAAEGRSYKAADAGRVGYRWVRRVLQVASNRIAVMMPSFQAPDPNTMRRPHHTSHTPPFPRKWAQIAAICALLISAPATTNADAGPVTVTDDKGREVHLEAPARRIISLAPHITENLFAVGAGDQIVGTVNYSDYPQAAEDIPRVGSYKQLDLESILALEPDLVVAWESGNVRAQLERLEALGYPLYFSNPQTFEQLASGLARLGRLSGHVTGGEEAETQVRHTLAELEDRYGQQPPVTVFYQVWDRPLMTLNEEHLISQAIHLCGGENIFGHLDTLVPRLNREVILAADPEAIIGGGMGEDNPQWVEDWRRWSDMTAVQRDNLFFIPPSLIQRPTPRILEGTRMICDFLETARERRPEGDE